MTAPAPTGDELAGLVEPFGALSPAELRRAHREAAFRAGHEVPEGDAGAADRRFRAAVARARREYRLVGVPADALDGLDADPTADRSDTAEDGADGPRPPDGSGEADLDPVPALAVGPTAFPDPPEAVEDLPHIMDLDLDGGRREFDRDAVADRLRERLRGDAARAVRDGDAERVRRLLDVTYDVEAWAPVDMGDVRDRLDDALAELDGGDDPAVGTGAGSAAGSGAGAAAGSGAGSAAGTRDAADADGAPGPGAAGGADDDGAGTPGEDRSGDDDRDADGGRDGDDADRAGG